ncbi:MAG: hypothetical protein HQ580_14045 [Planctomycetes bacterium]|nr:hypothetical protein [Planctomycetota bacterium]
MIFLKASVLAFTTLVMTGKLAARKGKWKLVGQIENTRGKWGRTVAKLKSADLELYNLEKDISESLKTVLFYASITALLKL